MDPLLRAEAPRARVLGRAGVAEPRAGARDRRPCWNDGVLRIAWATARWAARGFLAPESTHHFSISAWIASLNPGGSGGERKPHVNRGEWPQTLKVHDHVPVLVLNVLHSWHHLLPSSHGGVHCYPVLMHVPLPQRHLRHILAHAGVRSAVTTMPPTCMHA